MMKNEKLMLDKAYNDILQPIAKQVGITLGEVGKLILSPIYYPTKYFNNRIEKWFERIENNVPKENRIEAMPSITIPTLQNLALHDDDTLLGEMFFNILQSSVDKTKQEFLSPAFIETLKQLSKDEAMIVLLLKEKTYKAVIKPKETRDYDYFENDEVIENDFPLDKLEFPNQFWTYYEHLCKLGLCEKMYENYNSKPRGINFGGNLFARFPKDIDIKLSIKFNKFGKAFAEICVSEKCENFIK